MSFPPITLITLKKCTWICIYDMHMLLFIWRWHAYLIIKIEVGKPSSGLFFIHFHFGKKNQYISWMSIIFYWSILTYMTYVCACVWRIFKYKHPQVHSCMHVWTSPRCSLLSLCLTMPVGERMTERVWAFSLIMFVTMSKYWQPS